MVKNSLHLATSAIGPISPISPIGPIESTLWFPVVSVVVSTLRLIRRSHRPPSRIAEGDNQSEIPSMMGVTHEVVATECWGNCHSKK